MWKAVFLSLTLLLPAMPQVAPKPRAKKTAPAAKPVTPPVAPAAHQVFGLEKVTFEGAKRYKPSQLFKATGLKLGEPGSKAIFDNAQAKLVDSGAFVTVAYRYEPSASGKGYALVFETVELDQVFPVRFEGMSRPDAELRDHLAEVDPLFGDRVPATEPVLKRYAKALQEYLGTENVYARVVADAPDKLTLVFRSSASPMTIAEVSFTGADTLRAEDLRNAIAATSIGVPYSETKMRELLDAQIRPLYDAKGHVRVKWAKITSEKAKDVGGAEINGVAVKVLLDEGPAYGLHGFDVAGVEARKDLLAVVDLKTGDRVDFDQIKDASAKLVRYMQRKGFMRATVRNDRIYNDAQKWVDVRFVITPGEEFTFRRLKMEGLDIHAEPVVRKMWGMKEGRPFNVEYPDKFLASIREQGMFEHLGTTKAVLAIDEKTNTVDVTLLFKGDATPRVPLILGVPPVQD